MLAIEPISAFSPKDVGGIGAESSRRLPRAVVVGRNPAGLEEKSLDFEVAQMPYANSFQLHIYAAQAEQKRAFITQRTTADLQAAKSRDIHLGGHCHHKDDLVKARKQKALEDA